MHANVKELIDLPSSGSPSETPLFSPIEVITTSTFLDHMPPGKGLHDLTNEEIIGILQTMGIELLAENSDLLRLVCELGSTHSMSVWRDILHKILAARGLEGAVYDPQFKAKEGQDWKDWYADIEAIFKRLSAVLLIRIENNGLVNGSLGSIAEISMMLFSSILFGQKVVISTEPDIIESLHEPGALIQYMMLQYVINHRPAKLLAPAGTTSDYMISHVSENDHMDDLSIMITQALGIQIDNPLPAKAEELLHDLRTIRQESTKLKKRTVTLAGSGVVDQASRSAVVSRYLQMAVGNAPETHLNPMINVINAALWDKLYGRVREFINNPHGVISIGQLQMEFNEIMDAQFKQYLNSNLVAINIAGDQLSKGALTEVPLILVQCIKHKIPFSLLIEPSDPIATLKNIIDDEEEMRIYSIIQSGDFDKAIDYLSNRGLSQKILQELDAATALKSMNLLLRTLQSNSVSWGEVKGDGVLGNLEVVQDIVNSMRARNLIQADWRNIKKEFPDLPYFEDQSAWKADVEEYILSMTYAQSEVSITKEMIPALFSVMMPSLQQMFSQAKSSAISDAYLLSILRSNESNIIATLESKHGFAITPALLKRYVNSHIDEFMTAAAASIIFPSEQERQLVKDRVRSVIVAYSQKTS